MPYGTAPNRTETASGISYTLLQTPGTQTYTFTSLKEVEMPNEPFTIYRGVISANMMATKWFPNSANPREPDHKSVVVDMKRVLRLAGDEKDKFHRYNNGLTIVCSDLRLEENGDYTIDFEYGDGICNGGHTYFAISSHILAQQHPTTFSEDSLVNVEIIVIPDDEPNRRDEVTRIADRRNRSAELDDTSKADSRGWYKPLRAQLSRSEIIRGRKTIPQGLDLQEWQDEFFKVQEVSWHENDSEADHDHEYDPKEIYRWMKAIDPLNYKHEFYRSYGWSTTSDSGQTVTGGGKMHKDWFKAMEQDSTGKHKQYLRHMIPISHDIIRLNNALRSKIAPRGIPMPPGVRHGSMVRDWWQNGADDQNADVIGPMPFEDDGHIGAGQAMRTTMPAVLLGFYRGAVWFGMMPETLGLPASKQLPRYVGWMLTHHETEEDLTDFIQRIHTEYSRIADEPAHAIKSRSVLYGDVWNSRFGRRDHPLYPRNFIDRCDVFSKFEQVNENEATHIMLRPMNDDKRVIVIEEYDADAHENDKKTDLEGRPFDSHNLYRKTTFDLSSEENYEKFGLEREPTEIQDIILRDGEAPLDWFIPEDD